MELHPLPYYKWYWQQFRLSRKVQRMDYVQRGLYRDLLDEQWEKGSVSGDIEDMADICGCPSEVMASAWQVLNRCFTLVNGRYINDILEQQRTVKDKERTDKALAGKRGGEAKAQRNQDEASKCQADAKQPLANSGSLSRLEEIRLEEIRKEKKDNMAPSGKPTTNRPRFEKPTVEQIREYCNERKNGIDPQYFFDSNETKGWLVGKNQTPMKDWRAAIRTWEGNSPAKPQESSDGVRRNEHGETVDEWGRVIGKRKVG